MFKMSIENVEGVEVIQEVFTETQRDAFKNQGWKEIAQEPKEDKKKKAE